MENGFEKYIEDNQGKFEEGTPSPEVWQKLKGQLVQHHAQKTIGLGRGILRWSIAASIILLAGAGYIYYMAGKQSNTVTGVKIIKPDSITASDSKISQTPDAIDSQKVISYKKAIEDLLATDTFSHEKRKLQNKFAADKGYTHSLFYYTSLVEEKQKQVSRLRETDPELYASFKKVIEDMKDTYNQLKNKLPESIDQEKVLQDMIQNLRLQELMLNNQLQLIKKMDLYNSQHEKSKDDI